MKPTKTLILGLREAAQRLRTKPEEYNWSHMHVCNCGILAQCLMNLDQHQLLRKMSDEGMGYCT